MPADLHPRRVSKVQLQNEPTQGMAPKHAQSPGGKAMRIDPALASELLGRLETLEQPDGAPQLLKAHCDKLAIAGYSADEIETCLSKLCADGYVASGAGFRIAIAGSWHFRCLTPAGRAYLLSFRKPENRPD